MVSPNPQLPAGKRAHRGRSRAERLAPRLLLTLAVAGTPGDDVISVEVVASNLVVRVNQTSQSFPLQSVDQLAIDAMAGNDRVDILSAGTIPVSVDGGDGNDTFTVGGGTWRVNVLGDVTLRGGLGNDLAQIDDSLGTSAIVSITNPFNIDTQIAAGDGGTIFVDAGTLESTVEQIEIRTGIEADEVDILGISSFTLLRVLAGDGDDAVLVANDFDSTINSPLVVDGGTGENGLIVNDSADAFGDAYLFNRAVVATFGKDSTPITMSYSGFTTFQLIAGAAGSIPNQQAFRVNGLQPGIELIIDAGTGDDALTVGTPTSDLATLPNAIHFNGQAGFDRIEIIDPIGTDPTTYSVSANQIDITGRSPLFYSSIQFVHVTANSGDDVLEVLNTFAPTSVTLAGGAGNDTFCVGSGDVDSTLGNAVSVIGGLGSDSLVIDDSLDDEGLDFYTFNQGVMLRAQRGILWSRSGDTLTEAVELLGSANADLIRIDSANAEVGLRINAGGGDDTIEANRTSGDLTPATPVTIVSGEGKDSLVVNGDFTGLDAAVALDAADESLSSLEIRSGGRLNLVGTGDRVTRVVDSLIIDGTLDVNDQTLLFTGGAFAYLNGLVTSGYNGGSWNTARQPAIVSTTAWLSAASDGLAVARADTLGLPTFGTVTTLPGEVIVRYTLSGDTNLDRAVGFDDLLRLAQNYEPSIAGNTWELGNFNYDTPDTVAGAVGFDDLLLLAQNYGRSLSTRRAARES